MNGSKKELKYRSCAPVVSNKEQEHRINRRYFGFHVAVESIEEKKRNSIEEGSVIYLICHTSLQPIFPLRK